VFILCSLFSHLGKKNYLCSRKKRKIALDLSEKIGRKTSGLHIHYFENQLYFSLFNLKIKPNIL